MKNQDIVTVVQPVCGHTTLALNILFEPLLVFLAEVVPMNPADVGDGLVSAQLTSWLLCTRHRVTI